MTALNRRHWVRIETEPVITDNIISGGVVIIAASIEHPNANFYGWGKVPMSQMPPEAWTSDDAFWSCAVIVEALDKANAEANARLREFAASLQNEVIEVGA